ncbi:MAG: sensor histidine kinase [Oliverpabstia sp.]
MKNIYKKLRSIFSGFRTKLLVAFFICTLLPLSIIGSIFYRVTYNIASDRIINATILADDQLNTQINSRINQTENVADSIQYNMYTLAHYGSNLDEYLSAFNEVRNNIYLYKTTFDFHHIMIFLPQNQMGAAEGLYFYSMNDFLNDYLPDDQLINPGTDSIWFYQPNLKLPFILSQTDSENDVIACCRVLRNQSSQELEYAYLIFLNPYEFSNILQETFSDSRITSYIISDDRKIMAHTDISKCGTRLTQEIFSSISSHSETTYVENQTHYHSVRLDNGWYHVTEIPERYIRDNTRILLKTILITILIMIPLTILIIILISGNLTVRLRRLSTAMQNFQLGKEVSQENLFPVSKDPYFYDEIDTLGVTFTDMQSSLNENMKSILDLSLSEEKLKYQLLQSQINPHFLYNILGTIKTCQSMGKLDIADQMITDLTRFYRLSLRKSKDLISIKDELEIARLYLEMEKLCHNDTLSWEIHAEDGIENYLICKFTLQPFLENCIQHGYSRSTTSIHIQMNIMYGDDEVIITIADNGIGIQPEQLKELQDTLENKTVNYEKHFGIGNVNKRISSPSFGNGSVQIESTPGEGTEVTIIFEQMEE